MALQIVLLAYVGGGLLMSLVCAVKAILQQQRQRERRAGRP